MGSKSFWPCANSLLPRLLFWLVIVGIVLAAGCAKFGSSKKGAELPELYFGTEGVEAAFAPESVPVLITAGSRFDSVLLIANKGVADTSNVIVKIMDTRGAFSFDEKKVPPDFTVLNQHIMKLKDGLKLFGRETGSGSGFIDSATVAAVADGPSVGRNPVETGLIASVCYSYETKLTANVCIDASGYSFQKQRKPCDAKVPIALKSQGAPVAVKKIETITAKSSGIVKPIFRIYIANVGKGQIIDKNKLKLFCTDQEPEKPSDTAKSMIVYVDGVWLMDAPLECGSPVKILTGSQSTDFISCSYEGNDLSESLGTFTTPLRIALSYGYTLTSSPAPVTVERLEPETPCVPGQTRECQTVYGSKGSQACISGKWSICTA